MEQFDNVLQIESVSFVSIDVSSWANGMYIITSDDFNSSNTAKLNVQH